ncbi:sensor histidine kinase [Rheinheimera sp. 4Y26]|uniref:sensor histidine kinase n=1 Tax=Rheinheimera sp. 4Y26 TaxID=2977811 RepID=UPI0021B10FA8|nr:histidine kinase [Rheinheimera sp. 4Y26]MCT6700014.1 histidine kinase [Rheinheimera sp. 4Y26]
MLNHKIPSSFSQKLQQFWRTSFSVSREYKFAVAISFVFGFFVYWSVMQAMFSQLTPSQQLAVIVRSAVDTLAIVLLTHFLVRPYLKLYFIPKGRMGWALLQLAGLLYVLGIVSMLLSIAIGKIDFLQVTDITHLVFSSAEGEYQLHFQHKSLILFGGLNQAVVFAIWCMLYLMWHNHQSKKQMQQQLEQSRLQQLTNQLSPHFLFNALNSIRALIFEDQHKAADTVTQLSELFRTHLQAHLTPLSRLEEEWRIAEHYLSIEQVRLEQRLKLELDIAGNCLQHQLPTLSLLTLVENAIKHGISPNAQPGFIRICARQLPEQRWQLEVSNSYRHPSSQGNTHTGLANLQQRLALMPGQNNITVHQQAPDSNQAGLYRICMELSYD